MNAFRARAGAFDVVVDFGLQPEPSESDPDLLVRVVMSWEHTKNMVQILGEMVQAYEKRVGVQVPDVRIEESEEPEATP